MTWWECPPPGGSPWPLGCCKAGHAAGRWQACPSGINGKGGMGLGPAAVRHLLPVIAALPLGIVWKEAKKMKSELTFRHAAGHTGGEASNHTGGPRRRARGSPEAQRTGCEHGRPRLLAIRVHSCSGLDADRADSIRLHAAISGRRDCHGRIVFGA